MATTEIQFRAPEATDAVARVLAKLRPVTAELAEVRARDAEIRSMLDPHFSQHRENPVDASARRRALLDAAGVECRLAELEEQDDELRAQLLDTRDAACEEQRVAYVKADAADVRELDRVLQQAARIDARRRARAEAFENATGRQITDSGFWFVFDGVDSFFARWKQWAMTARGLKG